MDDPQESLSPDSPEHLRAALDGDLGDEAQFSAMMMRCEQLVKQAAGLKAFLSAGDGVQTHGTLISKP